MQRFLARRAAAAAMVAAAAVAATAVTARPAAAQPAASAFPSRPITLVVPFAPGASADGIARLVGQELARELGQPVVVDNRPGGGGALGLIAVARSQPDGHTIGLGATGALAINPHLPDAPPLRPERDLAPLGKLADIPVVLVASASGGPANLRALLDAARRAKGMVYGTAGQYTAQHLSGELLAGMTGAPLQPVPYRGSAPAVTDVVGGAVPAAVVDLTSAYPHVKAGRLVALGVTSPRRSKVAPEIPTIAEEGVEGYSAPAWMGLFLPAATPEEPRARLGAALRKVMASAAVQSQITALAAEPAWLDGPAFGRFIADESRKWAEVIARLPSPAK